MSGRDASPHYSHVTSPLEDSELPHRWARLGDTEVNCPFDGSHPADEHLPKCLSGYIDNFIESGEDALHIMKRRYCSACQSNGWHISDSQLESAYTEGPQDWCVGDRAKDPDLVPAGCDLTCNICFDKVKDKEPAERFGILSDCAHCFCWSCLDEWIDNDPASGHNRKRCPICRTTPRFILETYRWITDKGKKEALYNNRKRLNKLVKDHSCGECSKIINAAEGDFEAAEIAQRQL